MLGRTQTGSVVLSPSHFDLLHASFDVAVDSIAVKLELGRVGVEQQPLFACLVDLQFSAMEVILDPQRSHPRRNTDSFAQRF